MTTERVPLANVDLDPKIHTRAELDTKRVESYAKLLKAKEPARFPPVVLYFDGTTYWVADGYHRCHAHLEAELADIEAIVHQGGSRDAFLAGLAYDQGAPKSREDKRQNVLKALADPEWAKWSNRVIATHCGVNDKTVAKFRKSPPDSSDSSGPCTAEFRSTALGADGKKRKVSAKKRPKPVDQDVQTSEKSEVGTSPPQVSVESDDPGKDEVGTSPVQANPAVQTSDESVLGTSPVQGQSESDGTEKPDPGPPIDTSAEIFRLADPNVEDDYPVYEGATAAEVLARSGLPKPVNWGPPEPRDSKRDALPEEWVGPLYTLLQAGHGDAVRIVLGKLLKKFGLED